MTLLYVILGVIFQAFFALFAFMAMAFTAGASVPGGIKGFLLNKALIGIPVISACVAIASVILFITGAGSVYYWLHVIPVALLILFIVFRFSF